MKKFLFVAWILVVFAIGVFLGNNRSDLRVDNQFCEVDIGSTMSKANVGYFDESQFYAQKRINIEYNVSLPEITVKAGNYRNNKTVRSKKVFDNCVNSKILISYEKIEELETPDIYIAIDNSAIADVLSKVKINLTT